MYEVTETMPAHARVTLPEPDEGWSRAFYEREIEQYTRDRGAPPRTITLHPETMVAFGFEGTWAMETAVEQSRGPVLVSSSDYPRDCITLFE
jgi:hypothetical protein